VFPHPLSIYITLFQVSRMSWDVWKICGISHKKQLSLMGLVHAMRRNGPLPQVPTLMVSHRYIKMRPIKILFWYIVCPSNSIQLQIRTDWHVQTQAFGQLVCLYINLKLLIAPFPKIQNSHFLKLHQVPHRGFDIGEMIWPSKAQRVYDKVLNGGECLSKALNSNFS
jgi:hypothetical protein